MIDAGEHKNFYELLGVPRNATREEIKRAYREIASVYHPDSHFFEEIVKEQLSEKHSMIFKEITAAYHTLVNSESRKQYDSALPPELPRWKPEDANEAVLDQKLSAAILRAGEGRPRAQTYGVFGKVSAKSAFEPEIAKELHTIAEMRTLRFKLRQLKKRLAAALREILRRP